MSISWAAFLLLNPPRSISASWGGMWFFMLFKGLWASEGSQAGQMSQQPLQRVPETIKASCPAPDHPVHCSCPGPAMAPHCLFFFGRSLILGPILSSEQPAALAGRLPQAPVHPFCTLLQSPYPSRDSSQTLFWVFFVVVLLFSPIGGLVLSSLSLNSWVHIVLVLLPQPPEKLEL